MLYLIGIGLKPEHLTIEALEAIKKSKAVYLENYTSTYAEGSVKKLQQTIKKKVFLLNRKQVEERFNEILATAKKNDVALLVYGNIFSATTHIQMLLDAKQSKIKFQIIPGISIFSMLGKTGLEEYKFGSVVSVVFPEENFEPDSFYYKIKANFDRGLHTLCLLDIKAEEKKFMTAKQAIEVLEKIDSKAKHSFLDEAMFAALAGAGGKKEKIVFGSARELKNAELEITPQSLIVCGELNEKEKEAVKALH